MRATIKVLIVDDSALIRQMLTRALSMDPGIEVIGVAKNGVEAIEKARDLSPDVITLDVEMPELDGLEALPHIIKHGSARVLMLSTLDDPDTTYQALNSGAVDFINKPKNGFASSLDELSETLIKKIRIAYRVDSGCLARFRETLRRDRRTVPSERPPKQPARKIVGSGSGRPDNIVAIAASTGGPPALEMVFSGLPADLPAAYAVVQHLPAGFSLSLAKRLDAIGEVEVLEAEDGMPLKQGRALLAPYGTHMTVERGPAGPQVHLEHGGPVHGVRPAADPLFKSVAEVYKDKSVGVLLTGMGSDGADGLSAIRAAGGDTIAQNEETSVVWGMPAAAVERGAVHHLVPIDLVAAEIRRTMRRVV